MRPHGPFACWVKTTHSAARPADIAAIRAARLRGPPVGVPAVENGDADVPGDVIAPGEGWSTRAGVSSPRRVEGIPGRRRAHAVTMESCPHLNSPPPAPGSVIRLRCRAVCAAIRLVVMVGGELAAPGFGREYKLDLYKVSL